MKIKTLFIAGIMAISEIVGVATVTVKGATEAYAETPTTKEEAEAAKVEAAKNKANKLCPETSWYAKHKGDYGPDEIPTTPAGCNVKPDSKVNGGLMTKLNTVIIVIVGLVGIVSVVMIVIGGITFATSQGDTAKTTKGKNTVLFGIVGLIVALLAFAIVNFVLKSVFA